MFPKLQNKDCFIHKLELLIMQVLKYGKINLMIVNLIFGHLDVYFMKWQHINYHSKLKVWMDYLKEL